MGKKEKKKMERKERHLSSDISKLITHRLQHTKWWVISFLLGISRM